MSAPVPIMPLETPKSQPFSRKCRWRHQSLIHSAGNRAGDTKVSYIQAGDTKVSYIQPETALETKVSYIQAEDTKVSYILPETALETPKSHTFRLKTPKSHTFSRKPNKRHQSLIHSAGNPTKGTKVSYIQSET